MKFAQDLWRALLVFVVATLLLERYCPPSVETGGYSHPPTVATYTPPPYVQTQASPPSVATPTTRVHSASAA